MSTDTKTILSGYAARTAENLKKYNKLLPEQMPQKPVVDAMDHSLRAGGKRIRPALVNGFCNA